MQRLIVQILKKYLHEGYDDHQTEIDYASPFDVLMSGGVSEMSISDWSQANPPPCEDMLVRPLARELITAIRGVDEVDLYIIPDREEMIRILRDISPTALDKDKRQEIAWAEHCADWVIERLRRITPQDMWRGKRIER